MAAFRLAALQAPVLAGCEARLDWLAAQLPKAVAAGANLVALPELFAHGYNIGDTLRTLAEPQDGPLRARIGELACAHGLAILYGYAERAGDRIFNTAACVDASGALVGHHRKLAIPPGFEQGIFTAGAGIRLFDLAGLRIAILICYDAEFAETARHAATLGAQLIVVPTALGAAWGWVADQMIPTRGYENGVYLAYINHAGVEEDMHYLGRSLIAAPDGQELARAGAAAEMLIAEIDHARVTAAQARLPYLAVRLTLNLSD